jgi:putative ATP-dependent endonuclease of OLD family
VHTQLPDFFLHSLHVRNFRAIDDAIFTFQPGLNVIIGANNAAKTAAIDALRLVFGQGTYEKREDPIRLRPTDVYLDGNTSETRQIRFVATFYGRSDSNLPAQFYELACPDDIETLGGTPGIAYMTFRLSYQAEFEFSTIKGRFEYVRSDLHGGAALMNPVPLAILDSMRSIYLAPLRDLVNDRARVGAEIERLILSHTPSDRTEELKGIPGQLRQQAAGLIGDVTANKHHTAAGRNLASYAKPYQIAEESLSFVPSGISDDLFRNMQPVFAHALHSTEGLPLSSNGLGINQLIYASIVLSRRGEGEVDHHIRKFFLIEEPEAHLHPQLQDSFFHTLNQITDHQIFVTSHSPTITAKTDIDKISVMQRSPRDGVVRPVHLAEAFRGRDEDKRYLHKFLDVTRSQLLFASGAVFVEGVTEALLLQRFSEIMGHSLRDYAVEIVSVGSNQGFDHFRPLFTETHGAYHCAVFITDGDESPRDVKADEEFRSDVAFALDTGLEVNGSVATATGYGTFEFGLLRTAVAGKGHPSMLSLLHQAMAAAAPSEVANAGKQDLFVKDFLDAERPALSYQKMKEQTKRTCVQESDWYSTWHTNAYFKAAKSEFAFHLYEALAALSDEQAARQFTVPKYIYDAIMFVTQQATQDPA